MKKEYDFSKMRRRPPVARDLPSPEKWNRHIHIRTRLIIVQFVRSPKFKMPYNTVWSNRTKITMYCMKLKNFSKTTTIYGSLIIDKDVLDWCKTQARANGETISKFVTRFLREQKESPQVCSQLAT